MQYERVHRSTLFGGDEWLYEEANILNEIVSKSSRKLSQTWLDLIEMTPVAL